MKITVEQKEIELDDRILEEFENFKTGGKSIYNEGEEPRKSAFNIISVKNDDDIIRAHELFTKLNVQVISDMEIFKKKAKKNPIENYFLIREKDDAWRLQSHYIGWGMNTDDLEKCVDYVLLNGDLKTNMERNYLEEIKAIEKDIDKEFDDLIKKCMDGIWEKHEIHGGYYYTFPTFGIAGLVNLGSEHLDFEHFDISEYQPEGTYKTLKSSYEIPEGGMFSGTYIDREKEMEAGHFNMDMKLQVIEELRHQVKNYEINKGN